MHGKRKTWRVDWFGDQAPEVGDIAFNAKTETYHEVVGVRIVMNRSPLRPGVRCRYAVTVTPQDSLVARVTWHYQPWPRSRKAA